jgi:hypothetical protein
MMEFPTREERGRLPSPALHLLAMERRYHEIPAAVLARPQDVEWSTNDGSTALHTLCSSNAYYSTDPSVPGAFLSAVESILEVAPHLVERPTACVHWTPLHLACQRRVERTLNRVFTDSQVFLALSIEERLVLKLIQARPGAVGCELARGRSSALPFHVACNANAPATVLGAMLRIRPALATRPHLQMDEHSPEGFPLTILWTAMRRLPRGPRAGGTDDEDCSKMELLLRAATMTTLQVGGGRDMDDPDFEVLRAACRVNPCPREYVSLLIERHEERLAWSDDRGWLPLHHAVQSSKEVSQAYTGYLLEALLERYPGAASVPFPRGGANTNAAHDDIGVANDGMSGTPTASPVVLPLPLHVLIYDRCMTWHQGGVRAMVHAYPEALRMKDPRNNLVPFLESAVHATKSRLHLSTTYELLRTAPDVIANR